jgi:crotonobetainyl-CoA:carnitine CoA-transferase CaiB-like acyl-CoA transferase
MTIPASASSWRRYRASTPDGRSGGGPGRERARSARRSRLAAWGFLQWLEHPARPPAPYAGHALRLEATPGQPRWAAPLLGEHTALVLREVLGTSAEEIERLVAAKVAW